MQKLIVPQSHRWLAKDCQIIGHNHPDTMLLDEGYWAQDHYKNLKAMIPLQGGRQETYDYETYGWPEHISRKWGQQLFPSSLLEHLKRYGFDLGN